MKKVILYIIISFIVSMALISIDTPNKKNNPKEVYRVYLKGKSLGIIKSKNSLEKYINKQQASIKEKYGVKKVYVPDELDIEKEITYDNHILSTKQIYNKIKKISPFTIDGYNIKIKGLTKTNTKGKKTKNKDITIYTLKKSTFKDAVTKTVKSYITEDKYNDYKDDTQTPIKETGTIIENLYIKNKITISNKKIPTDQKIYMDDTNLTKFLLFGTEEEQQKYTVQAGDTISDIAFNNKMSTEEFLVANTKFKDENSLLYEGQVVTIGILHPQFDLVEEDNTVKDEEINYETETKYDDTKDSSYTQVEQAGVKGKRRVTQKIQKVNGETTNVVTVNSEQLSAPVKEIVTKGSKTTSYGGGYDGGYSGASYGDVVATKGEWGWPASCQTVSSPFGYRWGVLHDGTDIAGCGYGSNIFAAQAGTVVTVSSKFDNGKYITIAHPNGYYTMYAHLSAQYVREGQTVTKGQVIGAMGKTGFATGVHLHFGMWTGYPYRGGRAINAMSVY